jgi:flagellar export protein FliJ
MAGFVFRLESVLRQRKHVEEQRQRELAELLRRQLILQTQLRTLQQTVQSDKREMSDALVGAVDVRRIRQHATHASQVSLRIQQLATHLFALTRQIERARQALLEATKACRALETLRERQHERWRGEQERLQTAELDEIAVQRFARGLHEVVA